MEASQQPNQPDPPKTSSLVRVNSMPVLETPVHRIRRNNTPTSHPAQPNSAVPTEQYIPSGQVSADTPPSETPVAPQSKAAKRKIRKKSKKTSKTQTKQHTAAGEHNTTPEPVAPEQVAQGNGSAASALPGVNENPGESTEPSPRPTPEADAAREAAEPADPPSTADAPVEQQASTADSHRPKATATKAAAKRPAANSTADEPGETKKGKDRHWRRQSENTGNTNENWCKWACSFDKSSGRQPE